MLTYHKWVLDTILDFSMVEGANVLEVGGVPNHRDIAKGLVAAGALNVIQINNRKDLSVEKAGVFQYVPMDARKTNFPKDHFDIIFSAAVLEHLLGLDEFLNEMYMILKPNGILCLHGGPFWNSHWGHHLWVHVDGDSYEFNGNNPLPNWSHLYMDKMEMKDDLLKNGISDNHTQMIVSWVYDCDEINRFFYDDYVKIFNSSSFNIVSLVPKNWKIPDESMGKKLRSIYGSRISNFKTGEAVVVLKK